MSTEERRRAVGDVWRALIELWTQRNRWVWVANELGISPGFSCGRSMPVSSPMPKRRAMSWKRSIPVCIATL